MDKIRRNVDKVMKCDTRVIEDNNFLKAIFFFFDWKVNKCFVVFRVMWGEQFGIWVLDEVIDC